MVSSVRLHVFLAIFLALAAPRYAGAGEDEKVIKATAVTARPRRPTRPPRAEASDQISRAEQAERFSVKVLNINSNLFAPDIERSHGTGFIVSLSEEEGLIFTNEHVVSVGPLEAQKLVAQFSTGSGNPEAIEVQLVYKSPLMDFAVLKFDPRKLKRARAGLRVATLTDTKDLVKVVRKGSEVLAFGHPLETENVATIGVVSGFHIDKERGAFIQTSAAINPGNSGGPLIDMKTGHVIGINSAKIMGADNTGYVIPIDQVIYDFMAWNENRELGFRRSLMARYTFYSSNFLKIENLDKVITQAYPDFFDEHEGLIMVAEAAESSGLKSGDLILALNGTVFGLLSSLMDRVIHEANDSVEAAIIRNGKLINIKVPVVSLKISALRRQVDFVMAGGLLLVEVAPDVAWAVTGDQTRVRVGQIIPFSQAEEMGSLPPGSAITELQFGGQTYPIRRLSDVKQALKKRQDNEAVRFVFHPPGIAEDERGAHLLRDDQFGTALVLRETQVALMPIDQVVTPADLSLRRMKANFDFFGHKPANRDWRNFLKKPGEASCHRELFEMGEEFDQSMLVNFNGW